MNKLHSAREVATAQHLEPRRTFDRLLGRPRPTRHRRAVADLARSTALLLLPGLGLTGCGETVVERSEIRLDVRTCLGSTATPGEGLACGRALLAEAGSGLTACLAHRVDEEDRAALPYRLVAGRLQPAAPTAFPVPDAAPVTFRLFLLRPGQEVTACADYRLDTPCDRQTAASPASCLLALRAERALVAGDDRLELVYGSAEVPCGLQCNDPCRPNDPGCRKLCWSADEAPVEYCNGLDDDCDGETDEGFGVGEPCLGGGQCAAGTRECACHSRAACDPRELTDPRWQQAPCSSGPQGSQDRSRAEQCNGLDDDCDGRIDEEWPSLGEACAALGVCGGGTNQCNRTGDDVCCSADPRCRGVPPPPEQCNGLDDDCDGAVDEELVVPPELDCPQVGVCEGFLPTCQGNRGWICRYPERYEVTEQTCDGQDNDCDGVTDEALPPPPADRQAGVCQGAVKICDGPAGWQEPDYHQVAGYQLAELACDAADNDCDGATDEGCDCLPGTEQPCGSDVGECRSGTQTCNAGGAWNDCVGGVPARPELCNGLDDDCDGEPDDGNPEGGARCGSNVGECRQGFWQCHGAELLCLGETGPAPEVCDNRDQDCNGAIDDGDVAGRGAPCGSTVGQCRAGATRCEFGQWVCDGAEQPRAETCNGLDDDCDGLTDEDSPEVGAPCGSKIGECRPGQLQCQGGQLRCVGATEPTAEQCDGRDNDCNGLVDDEVPGFGEPCGLAFGDCEQGRTACVLGQTVCQGGLGPGTEECNGRDDDCDGETDEALTPPLADRRLGICAGARQLCTGTEGWQEPDYTLIVGYHPDTDDCGDLLDNDCDGAVNEGCLCEPGAEQPCGETTGECAAGTQTCDARGEWGPCAGALGPRDELCNGRDDDCDGQVDEGLGLGTACLGPGGVGSPCAVAGVWECDGAQVGLLCSTAPGGSDPRDTTERCNGRDDDCDGQVDEEFQLGGACPGTGGPGSPCGPGVWECSLATGQRRCSTHAGGSQDRSQDEVCNGGDDDCDGQVDEGLGLDEACTAPGLCGPGVRECDPATGGLRCSTAPGGSEDGSGAEQCSGWDEDCDGMTDEDFGLDTGCTGIGACGPGRWECDPATLGRRCSSNPGGSASQAQPESCDNLDNDCDGATDEELPTHSCGQGACAQLHQPTCVDGVPQDCNPLAGAVDELPDNGIDDDCDGQVDETTCPDGWTRYAGTGHCYRFLEAEVIGNEAQPRCANFDATLVSIRDVEEEQVVSELRGNDPAWIGLRGSNQVWTWADGSPVTYTNWANLEPSNLNGCVYLSGASDKWYARACGFEKHGFVCERLP